MARARILALPLLIAIAGPADAGFLTGTVAYEPATRLYTYSYILDDRGAVAPIDQIYIQVATGLDDPWFAPRSHQEPASYSFGTYDGTDSVTGIDETTFGWNAVYWYKQLSQGVRGGFSFTTTYSPTEKSADNYFLYSTAAALSRLSPDGILEVGLIVAPDFAPQCARARHARFVQHRRHRLGDVRATAVAKEPAIGSMSPIRKDLAALHVSFRHIRHIESLESGGPTVSA